VLDSSVVDSPAHVPDEAAAQEKWLRAGLEKATGLASKFKVLARVLDERARRLVAAAVAETLGFGGVRAVARASGLSRSTVIRGRDRSGDR